MNVITLNKVIYNTVTIMLRTLSILATLIPKIVTHPTLKHTAWNLTRKIGLATMIGGGVYVSWHLHHAI